MIGRKKEKRYGPVLVITIMIVCVAILSLILNMIGFDSTQTVISNGNVETTLITIKNFISIDGFRFIVGKTVSNFQLFQPLVLIIISLFGISICEKSGFLYALFSPLKRVKLNIIVFITIFLGVITTFLGDYSYIFLIPWIGAMYKYLGKNPIIGVLVTFLGITIGYGTGLVFNYTDYTLSLLTEQAAKVDIDKTFNYIAFSNSYIMIASTIFITFIMTVVIDRFLIPKLTKKYVISEEEQELVIDKKALKKSLLAGLIFILFITYLIMPINLPGAGVLLDTEAPRYIAKLLGPNSPFNNGLALILMALMIIDSYVYGKISGNIKNSHDFSLGLSNSFENLGFMFVLMFFICELSAIIEWTNIGNVIASKLVEIVGSFQFSGILLIIAFFVTVILMSIFLPGTMDKWKIASPIMVPLFMQSNITPSFTQFIFEIADGIGKCITPVFVYYIIMLAFLEKYRTTDKKPTSVFGILKDLMPIIIIMAFVWLVFIIVWYVIGLPTGPHVFTII